MKKLLLFTVAIFLLTVLVNQYLIMHPKRRVLQDYHKEYLAHPLLHNMKIEKYFSQQETPYLVVTYQKSEHLSKRIQRLYTQLEEHGVDVGSFKPKGTLLILHGKNGRKEDMLPVAERYASLGFTCILPDLPAHGENPTSSLFYATTQKEQQFVDDVLTSASKRVDLNNLYIWGMSLGGAFTVQNVAHSKQNFKGMILVATFDNLEGVLRNKSKNIFGQWLGTALYATLKRSLKLFSNFEPSSSNSAKVASKLTLPLLQFHGKKDQLINYHQGERLFKSFGSSSKKMLLDEEGDHHNILVTNYPFYLKSGLFLIDK